jgi:hypothetical protein
MPKKLYAARSFGHADHTKNDLKLMVARAINKTEPYQIDFLIDDFSRASSVKPVTLYDFFTLIDFVTQLPVIRHQETFHNEIQTIYLSSTPSMFLMNEKAFQVLNPLLLLEQGSQLITFYFEQKPFYFVLPPVFLSKKQEDSEEWNLNDLPNSWHYFRIRLKDPAFCVDEHFVNTYHNAGLSGLDLKELDWI